MLDLKLFGALALMLDTSAVGPVSQPPASPQVPAVVAGDSTLNCELAALMPYAPLTVGECKALMDLYQIVAVVNPDASRAGDEQMKCSDIRAELSRVRGLGMRQMSRFDHSIVGVAQGLSESIRANPRLGRLIQLGATKHCKAAGRRARTGVEQTAVSSSQPH